MANDKDFTVLRGGQLAVATSEQTGVIVPEQDNDPKRYFTALVQTDDGLQRVVKTYNLNSGGGGGDGANKDLSNISNAGKIVCSNMGMPSNTYETWTPGPSGTTYTAPADGYFYVQYQVTSSNNWFVLEAGPLDNYVASNNPDNGVKFLMSLPCRKGITVGYEFSNCSVTRVRYVYAVGSESEYRG